MIDSATEQNWLQRNWKWAVPVAGGIVLLGIACTVLPFIIFGRAFRFSAVYQQALRETQSSSAAVRVLGEPIEAGWWGFSGSMNESGATGQADMVIPVSGPRNSGTLYVVATKIADQWQFVILEVAVGDQAERINLLEAPAVAAPDTLSTPTLLPTIDLPDTPTPPPLLPTDTPTSPPLSPTETSIPIPSFPSSFRDGVDEQALEAAGANTEVVQALGEPLEGTVLHGVVDTTGAIGEADMVISISGPENSGTLYVVATKRIGRELWDFSLLEVLVDGQGAPIDLLEGGPVVDASQQAADIHYERGYNYFNAGDYDQAMTEYTEAIELDPEFVAAFNGLCWTGSLAGQAAEVMEVCERAVELAPDHGGYRDSRGLARALTGDYSGAIEDFEFYLAWSRENSLGNSRVSKREVWIAELKTNRNPFDEATLEALQDE